MTRDMLADQMQPDVPNDNIVCHWSLDCKQALPEGQSHEKALQSSVHIACVPQIAKPTWEQILQMSYVSSAKSHTKSDHKLVIKIKIDSRVAFHSACSFVCGGTDLSELLCRVLSLREESFGVLLPKAFLSVPIRRRNEASQAVGIVFLASAGLVVEVRA